jgi:hypothetical protein
MNNPELKNRGEAIDFLYDNLSSDSVILKEDRAMLGTKRRHLLWLFRSPEVAMGFEEEDSHWLVEDGTLITTSIQQPNRTKAYKEATGQNRSKKTAEILRIEAGMLESEERMLGASYDERLVGIMDVVWNPAYYPLDYEKIEKILDDIEAKYELKPIEMVQAYQMCEERIRAEMGMRVDV